jgi:hypothetical protein
MISCNLLIQNIRYLSWAAFVMCFIITCTSQDFSFSNVGSCVRHSLINYLIHSFDKDLLDSF